MAARLLAQGHEVIAATRQRRAHENAPCTRAVTIDIARAVDAADWSAHLHGVDAVVSCAGVLQDGPHDSTAGVHRDGIAALFRACEQTGVRRVVHVSALGVDRQATTAFARTKLAGDELLMSCNLDWIILRPSVVVGRPAYGGSALIRGLAALPLLPVVPGAGALAIVHLDDLVETVAFFLQPAAPARLALYVCVICFVAFLLIKELIPKGTEELLTLVLSVIFLVALIAGLPSTFLVVLRGWPRRFNPRQATPSSQFERA